MAAPPDHHSGPLKYQTWTLRVPIHCEGCKKKVKKILQSIDGVYMTTIDSQQHKVIVTGNIEAETLLKKLSRSGKPAQIWPDNSDKIDKMHEPPKNHENDNAKESEEVDQKAEMNSSDNPPKPPTEVENASPINGDTLSESVKDGSDNGSRKNKNKNKKNEGQNGNSANNGNPIGRGPPLPSTPESAAPPSGSVPPPPEPPASVVPPPPEPPLSVVAPPPSEPPVSVAPPLPSSAETESPTTPPMDQAKPIIESANLSPPNNLGPQSNHGSPGPPSNLGPFNPYFGPMNQPGYMYPPAHIRPPQLGISYNMAQPSTIASYYTPPSYHGDAYYAYPQRPMMHIPPPPPYPISEYEDDYNYRDHNDDANLCRLM